ncbi:Membrane protein involved in the export of O-antigen and teichoic acid [Rubritalea squalenifaciens DSM 18772]|uniref:Membrane protein involved in the export of O-antigen and teichoic acid n=1 Tax=Rubritalea squalenifaciens DSM 18772 TaxID=1123071 RepID=A0A1M6DH23_9BACT|nr:MATE family efflux transporter [Rubritalea squalenifaciens]SHI72441.1 Membrane protein involved in the export of O-antigen and teichoic acid [Rubritalea squalenifaciens DSM 18772]
MNIKQELSKTVASSWGSLVVVTVTQLLMIPVALSVLSNAEFALFAVIAQLMNTIRLAEIGVRAACVRLLVDVQVKDEKRYAQMWSSAVFVFLLQGGVILVTVATIAPFIGALYNLDGYLRALGTQVFCAMGIITALNYVLSVHAAAMLAGQRLYVVNIIAIVGALLDLVIFVCCIKLDFGLWSYVIAVFSTTLFKSYYIRHYSKRLGSSRKFYWADVKAENVKMIFKLGLDVAIGSVYTVVLGSTLLIFSGNLLSLGITAVLAVNMKLINTINQILQRIPGSADPVLMKLVSEEKIDDFYKWWKLVVKGSIFLSLLACGGYLLWGNYIVSLWVGEEMTLDGMHLVLIAFMPVRYIIHYVFVLSLGVFKELRKVKFPLIWEMALYVALVYWLTPRYGLTGLLVANLASLTGGSLLFGIKWLSILTIRPYSNVFMLMLKSALPLCVAVMVLYKWLAGSELQFLSLFIMTIVWCLAAVILLVYVILDAQERNRVFELVRSAKAKIS